MRSSLVRALALLVAAAALPAALPAADKPPLPADRNKNAKNTAPDDGKRHLADNAIQYDPLDADWIEAVKSKTPTQDAFVSKGHDAMIAISVLPASMTISPDMANSIMKKIRENRKASAQKFVQEPTVEKDDRFILKIHEKYQLKDKVADQLHMYRQVGPRVVLVTINSLAGEEGAKAQHEVAEKACLSAEFVKGKK